MLKLEERLIENPLPPTPADYIVVVPTDDEIELSPLTDEELTGQVTELPSALNPLLYLHSLLKDDPMYIKLIETWVEEQKSMILNSIRLYKLYDIDFYNKDRATFSEKCDALLRLLDAPFPYFYLDYTNHENNPPVRNYGDLTVRNDFIRNTIKSIWLMRKWAGSTRGYRIIFNLLNRLGAVHLTSKYKITSFIDTSTERSFRLFDPIDLDGAISQLPNSTHIEGASSIVTVKGFSQKWDTNQAWDSSPLLQWDETSISGQYGKGLSLEISLDRLVRYPKANYLMFPEMLKAVSTFLPLVAKAGVPIRVGCQLTLIANKKARFNSPDYSPEYSEDYTHPNILAKFQIYGNKFTNVTNIRYIKTGSGGLGWENEVFIPYDAFNLSSYYSPLDVEDDSNSYIGFIGSNEAYAIEGQPYDIVHTMLHERVINLRNLRNNSLTVNGKDVEDGLTLPTYIPLGSALITPGSINIVMDFSVRRTLTYTLSSFEAFSTSLLISLLGTDVLVTPCESGDEFIRKLASQEITGWVVDAFTSTSILYIADNNLSDSSPTGQVRVGNIILNSIITEEGIDNKSVFNKINLYEIGSPASNKYNGSYSFLQKTNGGEWVVIGERETLETYEYLEGFAPNSYNSSINQAFSLLPLTNSDILPSMFTSLYSYVSGDELNSSSLPQSSSAYIKDTWSNPDGWLTSDSDIMVVSYSSSEATLSYAGEGLATFRRSFTGSALDDSIGVFTLKANRNTLIKIVRTISGPIEEIIVDNYLIIKDIVSSVIFDLRGLTGTTSISIESVDPTNGLGITIYGVFIGNPDSFEIRDAVRSQRVVLANRAIRVEGICKNAFRLLGLNSYLKVLTQGAAFPTGLLKSYNLFIESSDLDIPILRQEVGSNIMLLKKEGSIIEFYHPFSVTNGKWQWSISSNVFVQGAWITVVYNAIETSSPLLYIDGEINENRTVIYTPVGSAIDLSNGDLEICRDMEGTVQEVRSYSKLLIDQEVTTIIESTPTRSNLLLGTEGEQITVYNNHVTGYASFKLKYQKTGIMQNKPEASEILSTYTPSMDIKYSLSNFKGISKVSEVAVFDLNDTLVAYGTFPPIEYDASEHHLSFNLLFPSVVEEDSVGEFNMSINGEPINETVV